MLFWDSPGCGSRFDDIDLPSAVKYLIATDPNLQVLGAAYLQHKCYSDSSAKKQVSPQRVGEEVFPAGAGGFPAGAGVSQREQGVSQQERGFPAEAGGFLAPPTPWADAGARGSLGTQHV